MANICVKLNYSRATRIVNESCYVDDGLTGAESKEVGGGGGGRKVQNPATKSLQQASFLLGKWNSSEPMELPTYQARTTGLTAYPPDPVGVHKNIGNGWWSVSLSSDSHWSTPFG